MIHLLLDTHVFVWWETADSRLTATWVETIADRDNTIYLSVASAWEVSIKRCQGKLRFDSSVGDVAERNGFRWLEIDALDAENAGSLDWDHRDPFDRMIVAQAQRRRLSLVTVDREMRSAPGVIFL